MPSSRRWRAPSGVGSPPRLFLRAAELNRDLDRAGAPALARRIADAPGHWFRRGASALYPRPGGVGLDGHLAVATWHGGRDDAPIRYKFYAKADSLLRVEVVLDSRRAVDLFGWPGSSAGAAAGGAGVAERLRNLTSRAAPILLDMADHVGRFSASEGGVLDLLAALAPLLQLAAPPPPQKGGGRPAHRTMEHARQAVEMLLSTGRFDASGVPTNSQVRKKLREMAGYGGLLHDPRDRSAMFALPPSLQPARRPLAAALVQVAPRAFRRAG